MQCILLIQSRHVIPTPIISLPCIRNSRCKWLNFHDEVAPPPNFYLSYGLTTTIVWCLLEVYVLHRKYKWIYHLIKSMLFLVCLSVGPVSVAPYRVHYWVVVFQPRTAAIGILDSVPLEFKVTTFCTCLRSLTNGVQKCSYSAPLRSAPLRSAPL